MAESAKPPTRREPPGPDWSTDESVVDSPPADLVVAVEQWRGPLPPPAILKQFEEVVPGSGLKVVEEFQAEAGHRRSIEKEELRQTGREALLGQLLALAFGSGGLGTVVYAISQDAEWAASILGGTLIVAGMVALMKGRRN